MINLLEETIEDMAKKGKQPSDVLWVGSRDGKYAVSWEEFTKIANIEYSDGLGCQEIAKDLVVTGSDWWLERHDYDGGEWWEFKQQPIMSKQPLPFTIHNGCWSTIEEEQEKIKQGFYD